jgi:hypothetical protein
VAYSLQDAEMRNLQGGATKTDRLHPHSTLLTELKVASSPDLGSLGLCGGFSVGSHKLNLSNGTRCLGIIPLRCKPLFYSLWAKFRAKMCGGGRINLWSKDDVPPVPPAVLPNVGKYVYTGYYTEGTNIRAFADLQLANTVMTVEACRC